MVRELIPLRSNIPFVIKTGCYKLTKFKFKTYGLKDYLEIEGENNQDYNPVCAFTERAYLVSPREKKCERMTRTFKEQIITEGRQTGHPIYVEYTLYKTLSPKYYRGGPFKINTLFLDPKYEARVLIYKKCRAKKKEVKANRYTCRVLRVFNEY